MTSTRFAYRVAALLFLSGLFHLGVFAVGGGPWEGPVSWRKAVTFGLSFGLTLATYAWVGARLRLRPGWVWVFTGASVLEVTLTSLQVWRRVPSHFNEATTFDQLVTRGLTVGGVTIIVSVLALTVAAFRARHLAPSTWLAVRVGASTLAVAMAFGGLMIAERGGSWKLAHGVAMHGVLLLPALAWALSFTTWSERRRTRAVALASAGYCALIAAAAGYNALT
ncbi:hypothetical protein ALI22I_32910 [Saccharothrix sp. ALI-22-I]|uniref:hypothetical protein n=1 Tax=Saccharothrix sp. ALI-22-I TaxID=1933778 RepID=UPI00097CB487|nr:hypothetical protein [Saccharothrix sp. ALI-22-I]ONI83332.1 hypothetical protein ALI22I_32910 [Saccharothrix sp. ALI-22-I]